MIQFTVHCVTKAGSFFCNLTLIAHDIFMDVACMFAAHASTRVSR